MTREEKAKADLKDIFELSDLWAGSRLRLGDGNGLLIGGPFGEVDVEDFLERVVDLMVKPTITLEECDHLFRQASEVADRLREVQVRREAASARLFDAYEDDILSSHFEDPV